MTRTVSEQAWLEIDEFVAAFERAWDQGSVPSIVDYLPADDHPHRHAVLVELLRVDLEWRSENNRACPLEEYFRDFPECLNDPTALSQIAFEDFRLRRRAGECVLRQEYVERFGCAVEDWPPIEAEVSDALPLSTVVARGRSSASGALTGVTNDFPEAGEEVGGFHLLRELGRGAFSRVFVAHQGLLANREVVLKFSTEGFAESDKLAQLQHSNIVPIHSVHRHGDLSVVCMPYFGPATLADLLREIRKLPTPPKSSDIVVRTALSADAADPPPGSTPLQEFVKLDYVAAVLHLGAQMGEAIAHAHSRGILHRDLKPANVLLAADGRPMLLDFNLSLDCKPGTGRETIVGGTLPYMAPEQLSAYYERRKCHDARSDIFSLGVVLYELLTAQHPYPSRQRADEANLAELCAQPGEAPPSVVALNPRCAPAVDAIVGRCLDPNPNRRYGSAGELVEDLRRQLTHRPLRYARNSSWRERGGKWLRRHPRLTSAGGIAVIAAVLLSTIGAAFAVHSERLAELQAVAADAKFRNDFRDLQVKCLRTSDSDRDEAPAVLDACREALRPLEVLADSHWQTAEPVSRLGARERERLSDDVGEILFLMAATARVQGLTAVQLEDREQALQQADKWNQQAKQCYAGRSAPHSLDLLDHLLKADLHRSPAVLPALSAERVTTPRDAGMQACLLSIQRRFREALPYWQYAAREDPQNIWAQYGLGHCYEQIGYLAHAAACYSACIALNPNFADGYVCRGVIYLKQREYAHAGADFDSAESLDADRQNVRLNRALARLEESRFGDAVKDLKFVIERTPADSRAQLIMARALEQMGDVQAALAYRKRALAQDPTDAEGWIGRGVARAEAAPLEALADFERALSLSPTSLPAMESKAHVLSERLARTDDAIAVLDRALELHPEQAQTYAARGVLLARLGKRDAAAADAARALALNDDDAVCYQTSGIYALTSREFPADRKRAFDLLGSALRHGYGVELLDHDPEWEDLRDDPEVVRLKAAAQTLRRPSP